MTTETAAGTLAYTNLTDAVNAPERVRANAADA